MYRKVTLSTYIAVSLIALGSACSLRGEADSHWTNIRIVISENRKPGNLLGCSEQHIREHIYARMIHKSLDAKGSWPFVVNAQSSIDKIVISVDLLAPQSDRRSIISNLEHGLNSKPSFELLASETRLVAIENEAVSARPQLADRLLWQLASTVAPKSLVNCKAQLLSKTDSSDFGWEVGQYQIAFFDHLQLPEIESDLGYGRRNIIEMRSIYDFSGKAVAKRDDTMPQISGDALFIGLTGPKNAEDHILAVAQIFRAAREVAVPPPEIRPFGIGGFILFGKPEMLAKLSDRLATDPFQDLNTPVDDTQLTLANRWARDYVCTIPRAHYSTLGAWADAAALHPYFSFWTQESICKDKHFENWISERSKNPRSIQLYRQFLASSAYSTKPYKVGNVKYSFCYYDNRIDGVSKLVIRNNVFRALRQYFRMDVGLSIDIKEKDIGEHCSTIGFISPKENHNELINEVDYFTPSSEKFLKRFRAVQIEYYCTRYTNKQCQPDEFLKTEEFGQPLSKDMFLKRL